MKAILSGIMGSHSVGTFTADSDVDIMSVVVGPEEHYLGLEHFGQSGTFLREEIVAGTLHEYTSYELKKFMRLCAGFNPNVIPMLYLDKTGWATRSAAGQELIFRRKMFNSKKALHAFVGYAHAQMTKMGEPGQSTGRMGNARKELREKFGYDTKYAYHAVRLCRMLEDWLDTGCEFMPVWRKDKDQLLEIRGGGWTLESVKAHVTTVLEACKRHKNLALLGEEPDWYNINGTCAEILKDSLCLGFKPLT